MNNKINIKFPSHILVVGKTETGKSHFIKSILKKSISEFDLIIIYSGTNCVNGDYDEFKDHGDKLAIYDEGDKFIKLLSNQEFNEKILFNKEINKLIILDDFIGNLSLHTNKDIFNKYASMGRHISLSIIISTQHISECTPCQRLNSKYIFVTKTSDNNVKSLYELSTGFDNSKELKKFIESHDLCEITNKYYYDR